MCIRDRLSIEHDLNESTQEQMNRNQREYYLRCLLYTSRCV